MGGQKGVKKSLALKVVAMARPGSLRMGSSETGIGRSTDTAGLGTCATKRSLPYARSCTVGLAVSDGVARTSTSAASTLLLTVGAIHCSGAEVFLHLPAAMVHRRHNSQHEAHGDQRSPLWAGRPAPPLFDGD